MRKRRSVKARKYAELLANATDQDTKKDLMLRVGYSANSARVPQVIEKSLSFKQAQENLARETGNATMALILEIQNRQATGEMDNYDLKELVNIGNKLSEIIQKVQPIQQKKENVANPLLALFKDLEPSNNQTSASASLLIQNQTNAQANTTDEQGGSVSFATSHETVPQSNTGTSTLVQ